MSLLKQVMLVIGDYSKEPLNERIFARTREILLWEQLNNGKNPEDYTNDEQKDAVMQALRDEAPNILGIWHKEAI